MRQIFTVMMALTISVHALSQADATALRKQQFNLSKKQVAIRGYDPVAYFTEGKAKEGKPEHVLLHQGVCYFFSSAANLELFRKNPAQYEPQYGGWCAYAMGNDGSKVEVDPETFKVVGNKLYLFYNKYFTNTLKSWNRNEAALMQQANANWQKYYH